MADEREAEIAPNPADASEAGVAVLEAPAAPSAPKRLDDIDAKVGKQGDWTSLLWTSLVVAAGAACIYTLSYAMSIERPNSKGGDTQVALVPDEDGEEEGKKGTAYDVGDIDAEMQNQDFEQPADTPPPDLVTEMLQLIDQTDFSDPNKDGNSGGGTEGAAGGLGDKGKGIGKGGKKRTDRWRVEYGNGDKRQYSRILDFFNIKLAAFRNGRCQAAEGFAPGAAVKKFDSPPGKIFFVVMEAARLKTDREFLLQAGIASNDQDILCQYYPDVLTAQLLAKELDFAKRKETEIESTKFGIRPKGDNTFEVYVIEQNPL